MLINTLSNAPSYICLKVHFSPADCHVVFIVYYIHMKSWVYLGLVCLCICAALIHTVKYKGFLHVLKSIIAF